MTPLIYVFLGLGVFFTIAGTVGVLISPDVYTRMQTSSLCGTTGVVSLFIAAMLTTGFSAMTARSVIITFFFLISSPVSTHIIARYAWNSDMVSWKKFRKPEASEEE